MILERTDCLDSAGSSTSHNLIGFHGLLCRLLYFIYVDDDVRTSQETNILASTACCGDSFTFLYVDCVRTSQETNTLASTACCRDSFNFYM
jgi:hypothetical protein